MADLSQMRSAYLDELVRVDEYLLEARGRREEPSSADPEVRRLLEAVAYLSAQTQKVSYRATVDALRALVAQRLDFAVRPLPARGLVAAAHQGSRSSLRMPQGTPLQLQLRDGRTVQVSLEVSAIVAPMAVRETRVEETPSGPVLLFRVEMGPSLRELGWVCLHVDVLGDFARSLGLFRAIRGSCRAAKLFLNADARGRGPSELVALRKSLPLEVSFGARAACEADLDPSAFDVDQVLSPLEEMRAHFQFPERDLFLNLRVPASRSAHDAAPNPEVLEGGGSVWLGLLLAPNTSVGPVSPACFRPNVLPVQNLVRAPAEPIVDAGLASRYALLPPSEIAGATPEGVGCPFQLQSVSRVVATSTQSEQTLFPTMLGDPERSYRLTRDERAGVEQHFLELGVSGTLAAPRVVRVEACWTQPGLDLGALGKVAVRPLRLAAEGITWKLLPPTAAFATSPVEGSSEQLVELLAFSNRRELDAEETMSVLRLLCRGSGYPWAPLIAAFGAMRAESVLSKDGHSTVKRQISLELKATAEELAPLVDDLIERLATVLSVWGQEPVDVQVLRAPKGVPLARIAGGAR
jgi:type VI secretion system protein ImpG